MKSGVKELLQVVGLMSIVAGVMKIVKSGTHAWIDKCIRPVLINKENIKVMCLFKKKKNTLKSTDGFVDLGLSVKWASRNVGAETPEGVGTYFNYNEVSETGAVLPTKEEFEELFGKCVIKYDKKRNGFTLKGLNGNEIFIPISGEKNGNAHYEGGYLWSCDSEDIWPDELSNYYGAVYLTSKVLKKVKTEIHPLRRSVFYINVREVQR